MLSHRVSLGLAACAVIGLTWTFAVSADKAGDAHAAHFDPCAKACADCMRECESCMHHCLEMVKGGKQDHFTTVQTCADCAEVCAAAGKIVARQGPMSALICEPCAKACGVCGAACEKFPTDEHMTRCAKSCRDCEKACREMLKHTGSEK